MNNIQKNFKQKGKRGLCMAAGGILDPEREQFRFDQAQELKQSALAAGNAQIGSVMDTRGLSKRQQSDSVSRIRGVMSGLGAVGDNPTITGLSKRQQVNDSMTDFTSGLRAQAVNAAATPFHAPVVPTSAPTVNFDDRGWKRATPSSMFADGGIIGSDGLTDAQRAKLSGARASLGVSNAAPAPTPAPAAAPAPTPAPVQQPSVGGAINSIRERQRMLSNLANGGVIHNAAEYWADDNAQFEKTNPEFADRVVRALNPMTGFGSAMGAMHTAASSGDVPGMVMAGATAIPAFGVLRAVPAVGAAKATVAPSLRKTMASLVGGATANAASDEYQSKNNSGLATGGVVGAKTFEFEGKGTGTSDDIPVKVAGNHVNVSDGEKAVILPAKTAQNPQALDMIEDVIEQTNGKPPNRGLRNGGNYVNGAIEGPMPLLDDEVRARSAKNLAARGRAPGPTVTLTPGGAPMKPMIPPMEIPAAPAAQKPSLVQRGIGALKSGVNSVAGKVAPTPPAAPAAAAAPAWYQPSAGVKTAARGISSAARATPNLLAPVVTIGGAADAAVALDAQQHRDVEDIEARGGFAASVAKDAFPLISGVGQKIGEDVGRVVTAASGGVNPNTGKREGLWQALTTPDGSKNAMELAEGNREAAKKLSGVGPVAAPGVAPAPAAATPSPAPTTPAIPAIPATPSTGAATAGLTGQRSIRTPNGDVNVGRDARGQLVVTAGLDDSAADAETKRAAEAERMTKDLARQKAYFEGEAIKSDLASNNPADVQRGIRAQLVKQQDEQLAVERAKAENEAGWKAADIGIRKEDLSIRRATAQRDLEQKRFENEEKAGEGAMKREEALIKRLAARFVTKDVKGNQTPDTTAAADFLSHADATVAEMEKKTRGTPEHSRWFNRNTGKPKGAGDLGATDLDLLAGLYDVKRRFKDAAGSLPGYADKGDSLDLMDYAGVVNGDMVEFPRLSAKQKRSIRAQHKDFAFEDGPIGALDFTTSLSGTPTDRYTRHFTQGK